MKFRTNVSRHRFGIKRLFAFFFFLCWALAGIGCGGGGTAEEPFYARDTPALGVWWWKDYGAAQNEYLDFAARNGVNEIYYSAAGFSEHTGEFIRQARRRGMAVFFLAGDYRYIEDQSNFRSLMNRFTDYQNGAEQERRFAGLRLDIEPHQHPDFAVRRSELLQKYINFVVWACNEYRDDAGRIEFDIPAWFNDLVVYHAGLVPLYEAVIGEADRVCVMAYRDTADQMYSIAKDEIDFAKTLNKEITLGVETKYSSEGGGITFFEEGKSAMYAEFQRLKSLVPYNRYSLAVHHIESWYNLRP
jgi:hypothetical protein